MSEPATGSGTPGGTGAGSAEPADDGSSFQNLVQALVAPREAFASLARRPRFVLALLLVVLSATFAVFASMSRVDPDDMLRVLEERGREFPPEFHDNPERLKTISLWTGTIWTPIAFAGILFIEAGLFMVILRLLGSEITFRQSVATAVHAALPLALASIVGIAVAFGREQISFLDLESGGLVASNLGFLASEETSRVLRALLTSFDLFSAWCVALLAMGYRIVARVGAGAAWGVALTLWTIGVLVKLGFAMF